MAEMSEAEMQEKLKQMSPEEIAELQKQQCIFCKIIKGEIPAKTVFEDDICKAVLDISPLSPGHVLIMPKDHAMILPQISDDTVAHLFMVARAFCHAMLRVMGATGSNIYAANGGAAGQRAPHFLIHVIPRKEEDGIPLSLAPVNVPEATMKLIQERLQSILGGKPSPQPPKQSKQPQSPNPGGESIPSNPREPDSVVPAPRSPSRSFQQKNSSQSSVKKDDFMDDGSEDNELRKEEDQKSSKKIREDHTEDPDEKSSSGDSDNPDRESGEEKRSSLDDITDFLTKK